MSRYLLCSVTVILWNRKRHVGTLSLSSVINKKVYMLWVLGESSFKTPYFLMRWEQKAGTGGDSIEYSVL